MRRHPPNGRTSCSRSGPHLRSRVKPQCGCNSRRGRSAHDPNSPRASSFHHRRIDTRTRSAAEKTPGVHFRLPHGGDEHQRIMRIQREAGASGVFIGKQHALPMIAATRVSGWMAKPQVCRLPRRAGCRKRASRSLRHRWISRAAGGCAGVVNGRITRDPGDCGDAVSDCRTREPEAQGALRLSEARGDSQCNKQELTVHTTSPK
jgi:hypothetical protein